MLTLGKTDFDYVNEFHKDEEYYKMSLGIAYGIPSESTLRMRLDAIGQSMNGEILSGNISLFKACHVQPTALENGLVPLDIVNTLCTELLTADNVAAITSAAVKLVVILAQAIIDNAGEIVVSVAVGLAEAFSGLSSVFFEFRSETDILTDEEEIQRSEQLRGRRQNNCLS